jgi:hypothetical protein
MKKPAITDPFGIKVAGFKGSERNIPAAFSSNGRLASVKFSNSLTNRKKFRQAIYKIAFSSLADFVPTEDLSAPKYNGIRKFVLNGIGDKTIICILSKDQSGNRVDAPLINNLGQYFIAIKLYYLVVLGRSK